MGQKHWVIQVRLKSTTSVLTGENRRHTHSEEEARRRGHVTAEAEVERRGQGPGAGGGRRDPPQGSAGHGPATPRFQTFRLQTVRESVFEAPRVWNSAMVAPGPLSSSNPGSTWVCAGVCGMCVWGGGLGGSPCPLAELFVSIALSHPQGEQGVFCVSLRGGGGSGLPHVRAFP